MKLRNKKTGEIKEWDFVGCAKYDLDPLADSAEYKTLADLNEEWEDYEESTGYWYIDFDGDILSCVEDFDEETDEKRKSIGNYFETKEEAEKAVEKLKAWKRLKDKGYFFKRWDLYHLHLNVELRVKEYDFLTDEVRQDLNLLFGGEE